MRLVLVAALLLASSPVAAQIRQTGSVPSAPIVIQMDAIPTGALVTMLLRDVMQVPYVIAPDVLADRRATSVNLRIPRTQVPEKVVGYLRNVGFSVELKGGAVYVSRGARSSSYSYGSNVPSGSPLEPGQPMMMPVRDGRVAYPSSGELEAERKPGQSEAVQSESAAGPAALLAYIPAHRQPDYFSAVIGPLLPGVTFGARPQVSADQSRHNVASDTGPDILVMAGSELDLERARKLVQLLDRPRPMVAVKAVVMQVSDTRARGSALSVLASIGGGKIEAGSFPTVPTAAQFVRVAVGGLKAVLSAVREDSRFKVVATPNLAALSGEVATMNSGSQVPTVGAVAVTEGGTPVQSVVYRDSGITLTVRPLVRGDLIELEVTQERSSFTRTTTGVEDSPTLNKSAASASVILKNGESVVLAGLTESGQGHTREGLFGGLLGVRTREKTDSELLVVLQAELVPMPTAEPGQFIDLEQGKDSDDAAPADPLSPSPRRA